MENQKNTSDKSSPNSYKKVVPFVVPEQREHLTKEDYDKVPVVACKYCNTLHIIIDEYGNDICLNCCTYNETRTFNTIYDYQTYIDFYEQT